jgi:multidrug resistance efflux pump
MKRQNLTIILLAAALLISGCTTNSAGRNGISGSGTIEADEYPISSELAGKVAAVHFDEGDTIESGEVLFKLDSDLLEAQQNENRAAQAAAQANLDAAQANLEMVQAQFQATLTNSRGAYQDDREDLWQDNQPVEFDLPVWYFNTDERIEAAQQDVQNSYSAYEDELKQLRSVLGGSKNDQLLELEGKLAAARTAYENARTTLNHARNAKDNDDLLDAAQDQYDTADSTLDNLQSEYDTLLSGDEYDDVLRARAEANAAQERYEVAQDTLEELQNGSQGLEVSSAQAAVSLAEAQVAQAQAALEQSQAAGKTLQVQLDKTSVTTPADGLVLYRSLEPGETIAAGETVMTVASLKEVNLIVYIPEEYYGQIKIGQEVVVRSDSYPNETFEGLVVHIADEAEFTPRNVQTVEGRKSTVYAIKIHIDNPEQKLKAGMPVDADFQ